MAREHKHTPVITHTIEEAVIFTFIASLSRKTTWENKYPAMHTYANMQSALLLPMMWALEEGKAAAQ